MIGIEVVVEGHKIDVDGVEHQLQRHQNGNKASADNEPVNTDEKHQCGHNQQILQRYFLYHNESVERVDVIVCPLFSLYVQ